MMLGRKNVYFLLFFIWSVIAVADNAPPEKFNFIALADIHFDPFVSCTGNKICPLVVKLRHASVSEWSKIFARYDVQPQRYRQDTHYRLFNSVLTASRQVAETNHAQFVLLLGDSLAHEFNSRYKQFSGDLTYSGYQLFVRKTLEFLTRELAAAFSSTDVYTVIGNNDSYQGDYYTKLNGPFFNDTALLWSRLIKNASNQSTMEKQFSEAGYYSLVLSHPENLRLIVMNTNLFSGKAKGRNLYAAALKQLNWLHDELKAAKENHQQVFIAMHIPEGIDLYATQRTRLFRLFALWESSWINRFDAEVKEFSAEIAGIFAGHLHRNWFQVLTDGKQDIPVIGVTSISPIFGNNPGFKSISYFTHPIRLDDFSTYSLSLSGLEWARVSGK